MLRSVLPLPKTLLARQGQTRSEVEAALKRALLGYSQRFGALPEALHRRPGAPGKWSPAQLTDHLTKANLLYLEALGRLGSGRQPLELPVGRFSAEGRMIAGVALPDVGERTRTDLLGALEASVAALSAESGRAERLGKLAELALIGGFSAP